VSGLVRLRAAVGTHPYLDVLRSGEVAADSFVLDIAPLEGGTLRNSMTRMVREQTFDVCEMSPTSYLMAREAGAPLTALPIFTYRLFAFDQLVVGPAGAAIGLGDLGGLRIGSRTWAQPISLWLRTILGSFYGVDLAGARWSFTNEDPVAGASRPEGSLDRRGHSLSELLMSGEIDVVMGDTAVPDGCRRLIDDPDAEASRWFAETGIVPANHLVVVRDDLADRVDLGEVYALFDAAKDAYLTSGRSDDRAIEAARRISGLADPMVNGWSANQRLWEVLVEAMVGQGMLRERPQDSDVILPFDTGAGQRL
jgi:4,5-dihydroxyphthalate decarboxylase